MHSQITPDEYDAWYRGPRGAWIGETEFRLLADALGLLPGESLLDVGCGTGYFTRRFAARAGAHVVGLDPDLAWLRFAQERVERNEAYAAGRGERLPFRDRSFDRTIAVASLCFIRAERAALREIVRVTRKRVAIGLIENALSDAVRFFHMDALSSAVGMKVDFDMALLVIASGLYRMTAQRMRGYAHAQARHIFRDLIDTPADVNVSDSEVHVRFHRRAHLPIIIASGLLDKPTSIPWWNNYTLRMSA